MPQSPTIRWGELTNQELVAECIRVGTMPGSSPVDAKPAWEEFFKRFVKTIAQSISRGLHSCDDPDYIRDPENVIWEIHSTVLDKLVRRNLLLECTDPTGITPWLVTVALNETISWLRKQGRLKRLVAKSTEATLASLDEAFDKSSDFTLKDTVAAPNDQLLQAFGPWLPGSALGGEASSHIENPYLESLLSHTEKLKIHSDHIQNRKFWIFRLSLLSQLPLSDGEIEDLAKFASLSSTAVREKTTRMASKVAKSEFKQAAELGRAMLYLYEVRRLTALLDDLSSDDDPVAVAMRSVLTKKIDRYRSRRERLLEKGKSIPRPSNASIAELVGLPEAQSPQVTVILRRFREKLYSELPPPT